MNYDALVIAPHPDAETQMGGKMEPPWADFAFTVAYVEIFRSASPLLVGGPTVFGPGLQG